MQKWLLIILLGISFLLVVDLLHPGYPFTHDGRDHVVRIANFYQSLSEGNIVPRWGGNLNWGYGHPVMEFLYPLPSYIASLFHFLGATFVNSYKLVLALGIVASAFTMFLWLRSFLDPYSSTLGAVLYMFAPYRMVDAYVRGDIGENLAFVFVPLVLWAIYHLVRSHTYRYLLVGSVAWACVILSHNAVALMVLPFFLLYALIQWYFHRTVGNFFSLAGMFVFGFTLSAFFWVPALLEGKYTLRNIVTAGLYQQRFVSFSQLLYGQWNYGQTGQFTVQVGVVQWLGLLGGMFLLVKKYINKHKKDELFWVISVASLMSIISLFLMVPQSAFIWDKIMLLQNFQFPWRFLGVLVLTTSLLAACCFSLVKKYKIVILIGIICVIFAFQWNYFHAQSYVQKPESWFTGIWDGTTDTGESTPIWSIRWMEGAPAAPLVVLDGQATVHILSRNSTIHTYTVDVVKPTVFMENTLYFPGWHIYVDGKEVNVQYQDFRYHGQMEFVIPPGKHSVVVLFTNTKVRRMGEIISVVSFCILMMVLVVSKQRKLL